MMSKYQGETAKATTGQFLTAFEAVAEELPKRSQDIAKSRFGISGQKPLTLEEIGHKYSITRERVRQVIREVCRKIYQKHEEPQLQKLKEQIAFTLQTKNGIMTEETILNVFAPTAEKERGAIKFFLQCLPDFQELKIKEKMLASYAHKDFELTKWEKFIEQVKEILAENGEPLEEASLLEKIAAKNSEADFSKEKVLDFLAVSEEIKCNKFAKWGLAKWKEVNPKGTREKAFLVLKEVGEPLHFREIAKKIDEFELNRKKTHPQTVHNELIKDANFVLVGRGIYALALWGYKQGTVKDVLEDILKRKPQGLDKEALIAEVLKVRQVKKTTIVINLNNHFKKDKAGVYRMK